METPKFKYKDQVIVKTDCSDRCVPGIVMASQVNKTFNRVDKTWVSSNVYLINFGEDRGCWYQENQLSLQTDNKG